VSNTSVDNTTGKRELFHAALPSEWAAAQTRGRYEMSTRGVTLAQEGFIHCSYHEQVEGVANRFYCDLDELILLRIDPGLLDVPVVEEPPAEGIEELFPHVYGAIQISAVVGATVWKRAPDSTWSL
jgi:uncharacterized protein (DUF952 family)